MADYQHPKSVERLIELLKTLPGVGLRGAERMAFAMLRWPADKLKAFGETAAALPETLRACENCGNLAEDALCPICAMPARDRSLICVVESLTQIPSMEKSGLFKGVYHVLDGKLSPLEGKTDAHLRLDSLLTRVDRDQVSEVILALSPDVEGRATAYYVAEKLKAKNVTVTMLAQGLPAGADISFANAATLAVALDGRIPVK